MPKYLVLEWDDLEDAGTLGDVDDDGAAVFNSREEAEAAESEASHSMVVEIPDELLKA